MHNLLQKNGRVLDGEDMELAPPSVATRHDKNDSNIPSDLRPVRLQNERYLALYRIHIYTLFVAIEY